MIKYVKKILSNPLAYSLFTNAIGGQKPIKIFVNKYLTIKEGDRVLDIGCGPGDLITHLPKGTSYLGFDISEDYIKSAKQKYGDKGEFIIGTCDSVNLSHLKFDIIIASGLIHHLDDEEVKSLYRLSNEVLSTHGKLVSLDCMLYKGQPALEKWIISQDRGEYVREKDDYLNLSRKFFSKISSFSHHNMLRIPYSHLVQICYK